ncbi:glucose-1-phosphate cytidylyltransferase [bacterium]|jgi:glucose-1-phosphate cytidylyltransferase|nr:glucose-1-phosphate cytidylyltransferase [bacterium]
MKVVILAGGLGTRISEETDNLPKPMIQIGGKPILWHIMKIYSKYGINDFIVCCGYKGYLIKEYFSNYFLHMSDITFCMKNNKMKVHHKRSEPWTITLVDTGDNTMTGGRIKKIYQYVKDEKAFCLTYGDGVSDVNISNLIKYHKQQKTLATLTAVYPPGRFGALNMSNGKVKTFKEKPKGDGGRVNGGFFVLSPKVINLIEDDSTVWEQRPMEILAEQGEMSAFEHNGFWQPMDTLRDKNYLENLWRSCSAPWKVWN